MTENEALRAGLVILGYVLAREAANVLKAPTYGPRLRPGERTGAEESVSAAKHYFGAERAANRGQCEVAREHFRVGERARRRLEARARRGDETSRDVRPSYRAAVRAIRHCERGA